MISPLTIAAYFSCGMSIQPHLRGLPVVVPNSPPEEGKGIVFMLIEMIRTDHNTTQHNTSQPHSKQHSIPQELLSSIKSIVIISALLAMQFTAVYCNDVRKNHNAIKQKRTAQQQHSIAQHSTHRFSSA